MAKNVWPKSGQVEFAFSWSWIFPSKKLIFAIFNLLGQNKSLRNGSKKYPGQSLIYCGSEACSVRIILSLKLHSYSDSKFPISWKEFWEEIWGFVSSKMGTFKIMNLKPTLIWWTSTSPNSFRIRIISSLACLIMEVVLGSKFENEKWGIQYIFT